MNKELPFEISDSSPTACSWNIKERILKIETEDTIGCDENTGLFIVRPITIFIKNWKSVSVYVKLHRSNVSIETDNLEGNTYFINEIFHARLDQNNNLELFGTSQETDFLSYKFEAPEITYWLLDAAPG